MKQLYKTLMLSLPVLSVLLVSHSVSAANITTEQCNQWKQQALKSNYAKNKYNKQCIGSVKNASEAKIDQKATTGRFYVGASLGQSKLTPRVTVIGASVDDNTDASYKLNIGYNINPKFAIEGFYANLGSATVHASSGVKGNVDYKLYGISGVYMQPFNNRLKGLAKAGYAKVENNASQGINYKQIEKGDWFLGLGLEYALTSKLSIKGEYEYFDKDIDLLSIGFSWRF